MISDDRSKAIRWNHLLLQWLSANLIARGTSLRARAIVLAVTKESVVSQANPAKHLVLCRIWQLPITTQHILRDRYLKMMFVKGGRISEALGSSVARSAPKLTRLATWPDLLVRVPGAYLRECEGWISFHQLLTMGHYSHYPLQCL